MYRRCCREKSFITYPKSVTLTLRISPTLAKAPFTFFVESAEVGREDESTTTSFTSVDKHAKDHIGIYK